VSEGGTFGDAEVIERFWAFGADRTGYLIHADERLAGFALIREGSYYGSPGMREISEFFVLRLHRRQHIGERVAVMLFDRYPGLWEVRELGWNVPAQTFWRTVIGRYTAGAFTETSRHDSRFSGVVQHFRSGLTAGSPDRFSDRGSVPAP
jgi:predicted acetyltransferase